MATESVVLLEGAKGQLVDYDLGALLQEQNVCDVSLGFGGKASLSNFRKIGFITTDKYEIEIRPKVKIAGLLQLLDTDLRAFEQLNRVSQLDDSEDWTHALGVFFALQLEKAVARGPLEGYVETSSWERTIRGRIQFSRLAVSSWQASPELPLEFDEYSMDIPENIIVNTALEILSRNFRLSDRVRKMLLNGRSKLKDVSILRPGAAIPPYSVTPLNSHYQALLGTSELIIRSQSIAASRGNRVAGSFLIDMARLFESYLELYFAKLSRNHDLDFRPQKGNQHLDEGQLFRIRPDYLWFRGGHATALADAKYKVISTKTDISNADINQVIAYCSRFGLEEGHLIFPEAPEFTSIMTNSSLKVTVHKVDLSLDQAGLSANVERVFRKIVKLP